MKQESGPRPSPIAGIWYNGDPQRLRAQTLRYVQSAQPPALAGEVIALVAPHAGHRYSGPTAGYAFRTVQGRHFDLVAVLSPLHNFHPGTFLTSAHTAYETPLGKVQIDRTALSALDEALRAGQRTVLTPVANDTEHSLEIELPFLQSVLEGDFLLLPLMVHTASAEALEAFGLAVAHVLKGRSALLVASTDLSHFYPRKEAETLDSEMLRQIEAFSPTGVLAAEAQGTGFACGAGAVAATLWAARALGADRVQILHHSTSGDITGDTNSVVGYGSAAVLKTHDPS